MMNGKRVERGQIIETQPSTQLRAELWSQNPAISPTLNNIFSEPLINSRVETQRAQRAQRKTKSVSKHA